MATREQAGLLLEFNSELLTLDAASDAAVDVGAGHRLAPASSYVSRGHFRIERRESDFILIDKSTNGTFVQTEDEHVQVVHRAEFRLWGEGWLGLGEPLKSGNAVRFRYLGSEAPG